MPFAMLLLVATLQQDAPPPCSATLEWVTPATADETMTASRSQIRTLTFFSAVSGGHCLPGDVQLTAMYFDTSDNLICSGSISRLVQQGDFTQSTTLEFHLTSLFEFVRWRSGPSATALQWRQFQCSRPDGVGNVQPAELERATTVRLYATILAGNGGLATDMARLTLVP